MTYISIFVALVEIEEFELGTNGRIHVHHDELYNIVNSEKSEQHTIEIQVDDPGFEIFTFTFG